MFAEQLRQAVEASPRAGLTHVSSLLWRAHAAGSIADDDAQALAELIEARKDVPAPGRPVQRRVGSRPRSSASMARRRSWAAAGHLPPTVAARFTLGEQSVLAVVAAEVRQRGRCSLHINHIAALAGVCRSTVKNGLRAAAALGMIRVNVRRLTAWRCDSNVVTVLDPGWLAWLRLRRAGVQSKSCPARILERKEGAASPQKAAGNEVGRQPEARFWRGSGGPG